VHIWLDPSVLVKLKARCVAPARTSDVVCEMAKGEGRGNACKTKAPAL
jgi:hypothetical protein